MGTWKISARQLFVLMVLFELGSAIVVNIGMEAKQDAWLAVLAGMAGGIPLYLVYGYLHRSFPDLPLTGYITKILGKWLGLPAAFLFVAYFLYVATRVLRDFGDLLTSSTLTETPLLAVNGMLMAVIAYGVYRGIEVVGRTAELVIIGMGASLLIGWFGLILSGEIRTERLLPVLENGWKPVFAAAYPQIYTFPYGELIVFTMILPYLNKPEAAMKTGVYAIIASGLTLSFTIATDIASLGVQRTTVAQFPLLESFSKVNVGEFIQRLDILVVSTLILGVFMKIMLFFYAGVLGVAQMFGLKKEKHKIILIVLLAISVTVYSHFIAENFVEHIDIGVKRNPKYINFPIQTILPLLLLIVYLIRKRSIKSGQ